MIATIKTEAEFKAMVKAGLAFEQIDTYCLVEDEDSYQFAKPMLLYSGQVIPRYHNKISWRGWGWCDWMVNIITKPTLKMIEELYQLPDFGKEN